MHQFSRWFTTEPILLFIFFYWTAPWVKCIKSRNQISGSNFWWCLLRPKRLMVLVPSDHDRPDGPVSKRRVVRGQVAVEHGGHAVYNLWWRRTGQVKKSTSGNNNSFIHQVLGSTCEDAFFSIHQWPILKTYYECKLWP